MRKTLFIGTALFISFSVFYFIQRSTKNELKSTEAKIVNAVLNTPSIEVTVPTDAPILGNRDARVTVVSFLDYDFQPSVSATKDFQTIIDRYQSRVKFAFIQYLREPEKCTNRKNSSKSCDFARLVVCASEQGKFFEIYSEFISKKAPIDFLPFMECMESPSTYAKVNKDQAFGNKLGIQTPPSFFVAGKRIEGGMPIQVWEQTLDALLKEVK